MRRIITILVTIIVLGLNVLEVVSAKNETQSGNVTSCQSECSKCATVCEKTLDYCYKQGGKHVNSAHVNALKDCISACKLSAEYMGRNSSLMNKSCGLCRQACLKCAETCETFKGNKTMQDCASECRSCAKSCEHMAG